MVNEKKLRIFVKYGQGEHFFEVVTKVRFQFTSGYHLNYTIAKLLKLSNPNLRMLKNSVLYQNQNIHLQFFPFKYNY